MVVRAHRPAPPLDAFIDCLWFDGSYVCPHPRERALPTGTVELVISLAADRFRIFSSDADLAGQTFREGVICGAQSSYFVLDTSRPGAVIGAHFRPGGAAPFFPMPVGEFTDRHTELEDVWGPAAHQVRERLLEAPSLEAMFRLLEQALLARLRRPLLPHPAVAHALREFGALPTLARVASVQDEAGYSPKRFIELFRNSVGLTPKLYCRIRRFQASLGQLVSGRRVEWAAVALDSGYCDQSHLNREFRAFSGVTPASYHPISEDRPSHIAIES